MKEPDDKAAEWRVFPPAGSEKRVGRPGSLPAAVSCVQLIVITVLSQICQLPLCKDYKYLLCGRGRGGHTDLSPHNTTISSRASPEPTSSQHWDFGFETNVPTIHHSHWA